ncbi:hypothetical protein AB0G73_24305 [Streptomyces sp. NPDC020719]|uniref:hypothetical protein n=1 Tax=Streptomyces sp. NPDC020719 TaxID=3154896 RepID=UPI0033D8DC25
MMHRTTIGSAQATASDNSITNYAVHAADAGHLYVTRADPDAGVWAVVRAEPTPVRRGEFSRITLRTADEQTA